MTALPPLRCIVTAQTDASKAVVLKDGPVVPQDLPGTTTKRGDIWLTESLPADNMAGQGGDKLKWEGIVHPTGAPFRFIDMGPGDSFPLHHTKSIDYGVCLLGEATLELSDGSYTTMRAGDVIVQLGNVHAWHNKSTEWFRLLWVVLPAKPIQIDGKAIEGSDFSGF